MNVLSQMYKPEYNIKMDSMLTIARIHRPQFSISVCFVQIFLLKNKAKAPIDKQALSMSVFNSVAEKIQTFPFC